MTIRRAWLVSLLALACSASDATGGTEGDSGSGSADDDGIATGADDGVDGVDDAQTGSGAADSDESGPPPGCGDADGDGSADIGCGGDDCDDADADIHPGADDNDDYAWRYDSPGPTCGGPIAIDAAGTVHMLCNPEMPAVGLRYATNPTGLWTNEEIEPAPGLAGSIAVDGTGVVHVAYGVSDVGDVRHASTSGGEWSVDLVEPGFAVGRTSVAVDDAGVVHIAYGGNYPGEIHYANNASGTFVWEKVDDTEQGINSQPIAIVIADDGPHIAYRDLTGALRHAARVGLGWAKENIAASGFPGDGALVVAPDGTLQLAWSQGAVFVAERDESGWSSEEVAPQSYQAVDLAFGPDGTRHVVFHDIDAGHYATDGEGPWVSESFDSPGRPSIGVDHLGRIHIAVDRSTTSMGFGYLRRVPPDGIDQDCDGVDGVDADGDGFASVQTGGKDCDDERDWVHPDADDPPEDGLDQNCDGQGG